MNTLYATMPVTTPEVAVPARSWMFVMGLGVGITTLFLLAVFVAGWTVNTAYHSAHLQQREKAALAQQKVLQEQLAQANSLSSVLEYAQQEGFEPAKIAGTLEVTTPVAANTLAR